MILPEFTASCSKPRLKVCERITGRHKNNTNCTKLVALSAKIPLETSFHLPMTIWLPHNMNRNVSYNRVPIQSSRLASHTPAHGASVDSLGESRTGRRRRELLLL